MTIFSIQVNGFPYYMVLDIFLELYTRGVDNF